MQNTLFIQAEIKQEHSENNKTKLTNDSTTNTTVKTDSVTNATMNSNQVSSLMNENISRSNKECSTVEQTLVRKSHKLILEQSFLGQEDKLQQGFVLLSGENRT